MKIRIDKEKLLEFKMDVSGVAEDKIQAYLRFTVEGVEYGFPAKVNKGKISVNIPPFKDVVSENTNKCLSESDEVLVKGRLDIIANESAYVRAWEGNVDIEVPVSISVSSGEQEVVGEKKKITVIDPDLTEILEEKQESKDNISKIFDEKIEKTKKSKSKLSSFIET